MIAMGALLVGCAGRAPAPAARTFVHPESARDARLIEALEAPGPDKEPPTALDYALKMPLVVPHTVALFVKDLPGALAGLAYLPVGVGACILETLGILKPARESPFEFRERPR
jgi:hypothetical protein